MGTKSCWGEKYVRPPGSAVQMLVFLDVVLFGGWRGDGDDLPCREGSKVLFI